MRFTKFLIMGLITISFGAVAESLACDISSAWKHADKAAWLNVDLAERIITVKSHKENPKANGLTVIKGLSKQAEGNQWLAKMYDARVNDYVPVQLELNGCKELNVTNANEKILRLVRE